MPNAAARRQARRHSLRHCPTGQILTFTDPFDPNAVQSRHRPPCLCLVTLRAALVRSIVSAAPPRHFADAPEEGRLRREAVRTYSVREALLNPKVLALGLVYFGSVASTYGLSFFLPQSVKAFGLTNAQTGFVTLIPYAVATVGMIYWGRRSDRKRERKGHEAFALAVAAAGKAAAALTENLYLKMLFFSICAFGVYDALPVFWTLPTAFLSGPAAAGGIAIINALGSLAGFIGPYVIGYIKDATGSFTGGLRRRPWSEWLWCCCVRPAAEGAAAHARHRRLFDQRLGRAALGLAPDGVPDPQPAGARHLAPENPATDR